MMFLIPARMTLINNQLVGPQATCITNFKFLASQEVLFLLQVFAVSLKEAKGTFLTPAKIISKIFFMIDHLVMNQATCI